VTASLPDRRPADSRWSLRTLHTPEEMAAVEALQRIIWPGDDLEVVPAHVLLTAAHNGGLAAGAFAGDTLAGFVWGFLGLDASAGPPRLKHCSHQLGVHPDYRNTGLGFGLKCFQREFVLHQGLDRITWTYDPLLARNARLNIAKLGAVCNTHLRDLYGEMRDALNAGLPSDRFQVDWWIASERVVARVRGERDSRPGLAGLLEGGAILLNPPTSPSEPALPDFITADLFKADLFKGSTVLVEIPADFLALKAADPALALRWRLGTRQTFEALFGWGFAITDFVSGAAPVPRAVYVLTRGATQ
jgi:predicted GNAT superfamily acetyltransferase